VTVYVVTSAAGGCAIRAGTNDIRIIGVEVVEISGGQANGWLYLGSPGNTISGGSLQTPQPAREGAPASTATARVAGGVAAGTWRLCGSYIAPSTNGSSGPVVGVTRWEPEADLIIPSTGTFHQTGQGYQTFLWYEELRLSYGY
jgi:hypothetical protein